MGLRHLLAPVGQRSGIPGLRGGHRRRKHRIDLASLGQAPAGIGHRLVSVDRIEARNRCGTARDQPAVLANPNHGGLRHRRRLGQRRLADPLAVGIHPGRVGDDRDDRPAVLASHGLDSVGQRFARRQSKSIGQVRDRSLADFSAIGLRLHLRQRRRGQAEVRDVVQHDEQHGLVGLVAMAFAADPAAVSQRLRQPCPVVLVNGLDLLPLLGDLRFVHRRRIHPSAHECDRLTPQTLLEVEAAIEFRGHGPPSVWIGVGFRQVVGLPADRLGRFGAEGKQVGEHRLPIPVHHRHPVPPGHDPHGGRLADAEEDLPVCLADHAVGGECLSMFVLQHGPPLIEDQVQAAGVRTLLVRAVDARRHGDGWI